MPIVEYMNPVKGPSLAMLMQELSDAMSAVEVDEATGEVVGLDRVRAIAADTQEKIATRGRVILSFSAVLDGMKEHRKSLSNRIKALEKAIDYLKDTTAEGMTALEIEKLQEIDVALSFRKSAGVEIFDESQIPPEYFVPQPPKLSKTLIDKALKEGQNVPGARLYEKLNLQVKG